MPTFNSQRFVELSIRSVQAQTLTNWELLICDDASTDGTVELLQSLAARDNRIKVVFSPKNRGAAAARNNAIRRAAGEYVAFLDSDDLWMPNKLEQQKMHLDSGIDFSFTPYEVVDEAGVPTGKFVDCRAPKQVNYLDMLNKRATMGCLTVAIRRSVLQKYQMPPIRQGQDYALWLAVLHEVPFAHRMDTVLSHYRNVPGSISSNKARKAARQWQIYREIEGLPLVRSLWYFVNYVRNALFRR